MHRRADGETAHIADHEPRLTKLVGALTITSIASCPTHPYIQVRWRVGEVRHLGVLPDLFAVKARGICLCLVVQRR
jgi:hypothetical protein